MLPVGLWASNIPQSPKDSFALQCCAKQPAVGQKRPGPRFEDCRNRTLPAEGAELSLRLGARSLGNEDLGWRDSQKNRAPKWPWRPFLCNQSTKGEFKSHLSGTRPLVLKLLRMKPGWRCWALLRTSLVSLRYMSY